MEVVTSLDRAIWKKFVDAHPQGNVFHTPEMFDVYAQTHGYRPCLWATLGDEGQILALFMPVQIALLDGPLRFVTSRNVAFGSVLAVDGEVGAQALSLLLKTYNRRVSGWPLFTELRNIADLSGVQGVLKNAGYAYEEHHDYHIGLRRDLYDILQSFSRDERHRLRQCLRRGTVKMREITEREELPVFYELLQKSYQAARVPLAHPSLFEAAFDVLLPQGMARFTIATVNAVPIAAAVSLPYKDVVFGWYSGTDRSHASYSPNELMCWEEIQWGAEHGYRIVDLGGAGKPSESYGVRDFETKFNGQLVSYGRNTYVHTPWRLKLSEKSYQLGRDVLLAMSFHPSKTPPNRTALASTKQAGQIH